MFLYDWYTVENFYSSSECDEILHVCQTNHSHILRDSPAVGKNVSTKIVGIEYFETKLDKMFKMAHVVNQNYYGFNLFQEPSLGINFNVYSEDNNEYPYHRDCNVPGTSCDSKLTVIVNISKEPYEGGDFFMYFGYDRPMPELHQRGTLFIFPCYTYHKVTPVTKGSRITISTWMQGPNFQ